MRSFLATTLAALTGTLTAAQFLNQSEPFQLVLLSANETLNGSILAACHAGAAIEALCISSTVGGYVTNFTFNYTESFQPPSTFGYLTYELRGVDFAVSEPMDLTINPSSNVALPLFAPTYSSTTVGFNDNDLLYIGSYVDDTTVPVKAVETVPYYRWYACESYYTGYRYQTLAWVLGQAPPQNPSCVKVDVKRVFV